MKNGPFSVCRVVTTGSRKEDLDECVEFCTRALAKACQSLKEPVSVVQTPGGFLFDVQHLAGFAAGPDSDPSDFSAIARKAQSTAERVLTADLRRLLAKSARFLTLGVDVWNDDDSSSNHAELVGTYDTRREEFVYWTGKSYPLASQQNSLIYCTELETHFQDLGGIPVMVLGCHDLNVFSPRSRASLSPGTYKAETISRMQEISDRFKPQIVLQHPHYTDSPRIWSLPWSGVMRWVPSCRAFSSGIHYANMNGNSPRRSLKSVLEATAKGPVTDCIVPID